MKRTLLSRETLKELVNATRCDDDSAGRRAEQAGRLCYPSWSHARSD